MSLFLADTISECKQLSFSDVFNTWTAGYCDVILTGHFDALSMGAIIMAMELPCGKFGHADSSMLDLSEFIVSVFLVE